MRNQTDANIFQANFICFIKSRSVKHTEVLSLKSSDNKTK